MSPGASLIVILSHNFHTNIIKLYGAISQCRILEEETSRLKYDARAAIPEILLSSPKCMHDLCSNALNQLIYKI